LSFFCRFYIRAFTITGAALDCFDAFASKHSTGQARGGQIPRQERGAVMPAPPLY